MKIPLLLLVPASLAFAQPFAAGIKAGLPLTDFLNTVNGVTSSTTNRYIVGPMVELRLPFGLGVEFDALYRHFDYTNIVGSGVNALTSTRTYKPPVALGVCGFSRSRAPYHGSRPLLAGGVKSS